MSETTTTHWACLHCPAGGVYQQALSGGEAEKHVKATGHATVTSLHPISCGVTVYRTYTPRQPGQRCGEPVVGEGLCEKHLADKRRLA